MMHAEQQASLDAVLETVHGVIRRFDRSYLLGCQKEQRFPQELWAALADSGLMGLGVAEADGGMGGGLVEAATMVQVLARHGLGLLHLPLTLFSRHVLVRHGSAEQRRRYLTPTVTGEKKFCLGVTEPNAGTNTFKIQTTARKGEDGQYRVNGQKIFISGADEADYMTLITKTPGAPHAALDPRASLSVLIVDMKSKGISMQPLQIQVTEPERQFIVFFEDVLVSPECLIGEEGMGARYMFDTLNPERILLGAMAIGIGHFVLEKAVDYAKMRAPFDEPIGSYQAVQHPLARAWAHLEAANAMLQQACQRYDAGEEAGALANTTKLLASEAAVEAVNAAIQCHGGYGFDRDYDVITFWPLARLLEVAPVNNQMILNFLAEKVLGLPRSYGARRTMPGQREQ